MPSFRLRNRERQRRSCPLRWRGLGGASADPPGALPRKWRLGRCGLDARQRKICCLMRCSPCRKLYLAGTARKPVRTPHGCRIDSSAGSIGRSRARGICDCRDASCRMWDRSGRLNCGACIRRVDAGERFGGDRWTEHSHDKPRLCRARNGAGWVCASCSKHPGVGDLSVLYSSDARWRVFRNVGCERETLERRCKHCRRGGASDAGARKGEGAGHRRALLSPATACAPGRRA
jgi:hypothetical protein